MDIIFILFYSCKYLRNNVLYPNKKKEKCLESYFLYQIRNYT